MEYIINIWAWDLSIIDDSYSTLNTNYLIANSTKSTHRKLNEKSDKITGSYAVYRVLITYQKMLKILILTSLWECSKICHKNTESYDQNNNS